MVVTGAGLAYGYLGGGAEEPTPFIVLPDGRRAYQTGDIGRWTTYGLEIIARRSEETKTVADGANIADIEALLNEHPSVHDVAVMVYEIGGEPRIVAHVTIDDQDMEGEPEVELSRHLEARMAVQSLPPIFKILASMPVTISGKIDRKQLLPPGGDGTPEIGGH